MQGSQFRIQLKTSYSYFWNRNKVHQHFEAVVSNTRLKGRMQPAARGAILAFKRQEKLHLFNNFLK